MEKYFNPIFAALIFISAALAMCFDYLANVQLYAVFKPLTTILIIVNGLVIYRKRPSPYLLFVDIALIFALIGDILLIPEAWFLYGLSFFFMAHIFFIIAFTRVGGFKFYIFPVAFMGIAAAVYFMFLQPHLHAYEFPVAAYMICILVMSWQAIGLAIYRTNRTTILIAWASLVFAFSDSLIAYAKFVSDFNLAGIFILASYWVAIYSFMRAGWSIKSVSKSLF